MASDQEMRAVFDPGDLLMSAGSAKRDGFVAVRLALLGFMYYSSVYFIRMAIFAGSWRDECLPGGADFKAAIGVASFLGYLSGKPFALLITSKLPYNRLRTAHVAVIVISGSCSAAVGLLPPVGGVLLYALSTSALAPAWGLLMRCLEGRARTEAIAAFVSLSWIGVSGVVKAIGRSMLDAGLSERQMVMACAAIGVLGGCTSAVLLSLQAAPSAIDRHHCGHRLHAASARSELRRVFSNHGIGIVPCIMAYVISGVLRIIRDYWQPELLGALGVCDPFAMAESEMGLSVLVLGLLAMLSAVRDSLTALRLMCALGLAGFALVGGLTLLWRAGLLDGFQWLTGMGFGVFLAYTPPATVLYDRLFAAAREDLTSTPLVVLGDAAGSLFSAVVLSWLMMVRREAGGDGGACAAAGAREAAAPGSPPPPPAPPAPAALEAGTAPCPGADETMLRIFVQVVLLGSACSFVLSCAAAVSFDVTVRRSRRRAAARRQRSGASNATELAAVPSHDQPESGDDGLAPEALLPVAALEELRTASSHHLTYRHRNTAPLPSNGSAAAAANDALSSVPEPAPAAAPGASPRQQTA